MQVNVKNAQVIGQTSQDLQTANNNIKSRCEEKINILQQLFEETQAEEQTSMQMLETARAVEAAALAVLMAAQARLAMALAAEASAIASGNPIAIATATAEVAMAGEAVYLATPPYEIAVKHRQALEGRYEMAVQSLNLANILLEQARAELNGVLILINGISFEGSYRLQNAYGDILKYLNEYQPMKVKYTDFKSGNSYKNEVKSQLIDTSEDKFEKWEKYEPKEKIPVYPQEIVDRLNCSDEIAKGLLFNLYQTDDKFRNMIDNYRVEYQSTGDRKAIETKIRKNMAGRLGEEIVMSALKPYGNSFSTQNRYVTEDGSYTKTDLIINDLKVPIILGKGQGAREGQSFAIEVKCGEAKYILSQENHLIFQTKGHKESEISCIICSRDIKDISNEKQEEFRSKMRDTGSPILGMLPKKSELDKICFDFVFGE